MSDFSANVPNPNPVMTVQQSSTPGFNNSDLDTDHSTLPAQVPKKRRKNFTAEEVAILNDLWGKGMTEARSTGAQRLVEQAAALTHSTTTEIKTWVHNKRKNLQKAGGNARPKRVRPTKRKKSAQNVYLSQRLAEGATLTAAQQEYREIKAENGDRLRLLQAEAKQAKPVTLEDLSTKDKRLEAKTLIKKLQDLAHEFETCNMEVAVLLFSKDHPGVGCIGTRKGKQFLIDQEPHTALSLQFAKAMNDGKVPEAANNTCTLDLAKEVRAMLSEKYEALTGDKRGFPYQRFSLKDGSITVHWIPEGISIDHIASIRKDQLEALLQEKDNITVEIHSTPNPHAPDPSSSAAGTSMGESQLQETNSTSMDMAVATTGPATSRMEESMEMDTETGTGGVDEEVSENTNPAGPGTECMELLLNLERKISEKVTQQQTEDSEGEENISQSDKRKTKGRKGKGKGEGKSKGKGEGKGKGKGKGELKGKGKGELKGKGKGKGKGELKGKGKGELKGKGKSKGKSKESSEYYFVEKIMDTRMKEGEIQFYVKWQDYPEKDNTWEPWYNIPSEVRQNLCQY
ncbi:uncharacterized protein LOC118424216 [Branchiostoma floridae]|uniref:Uncharacterized protein LOC118424216 n=2 Tax=Branchiostoma floridae TaxID=7739 RepID=A0A9J7LUD6_BRAFL|nr:uncharacterized protein LOC118424216 [Branchiostoma floridae]